MGFESDWENKKWKRSSSSSNEKQYFSYLLFPRSSHPKAFWKKKVLNNFAEFTGKRLCQSLFNNKAGGLRSAILLKKRLWQVFFSEFCENFKNIFFIEHLWWLLLLAPCILSHSPFQLISPQPTLIYFTDSVTLFQTTPWTQDVNWTSYVRSIYVLCPGDPVFKRWGFYETACVSRTLGQYITVGQYVRISVDC